MRRKPRYDLRLTMTWSVTLAFIASFAFASVAGASATIVSPVQDSTIVESNSITYVFDTGVAQPSGSLWYIRFSSSPQVGPEGLLAKRDLGDGAKYGDDMASTAWGKTPTQLGLGLGVPDAPGVVYWQPYESVYHDDCSCSRPDAGPVAKVTITTPPVVMKSPRIRAFGSGVVTVPRKRVYLASVACDAPPCRVTGDVQTSVRGKRIYNVWKNARARKVDIAVNERTSFKSAAAAFAVWSSRTDFNEAALLRTIKASGPVTLTTRLAITDASGRHKDLTRHVLLRRPAKTSRTPSSSSPSAPSREEQAEGAAGRALDQRNLLYYVARCDLIGPKTYDCLVRPLAGADQPDRHATVRRVGNRWYVGTFNVVG